MYRQAIRLLILLMVWTTVTGQSSICHAQSAEDVSQIRLYFEVRQIINTKCYRCHGRTDRGGLRLDTLESAQLGGHSGGSILSSSLAENELYRRITSTDPTQVMPPEGERLSDDEVEVIRRWVELGAHWPDNNELVAGSPEHRASAIGRLRDLYVDWIRPYRIVWAAMVVAFVIAVEVWRWLMRRGHHCTLGRGRYISAVIRWLHPSWYATGVCCVAALILYYRCTSYAAQIKMYQERFSRLEWIKYQDDVIARFGSPPVPIRPQGPLSLNKTYYRGNCERHPKLYNHGHYRTATFRLSLCDLHGTELAPGDEVPDKGCSVLFEIHRAPGTDRRFYTEKIMGRMFFSHSAEAGNEVAPLARLKVSQPEQVWNAHVPIELDSTPPDMTIDGMIYVHLGKGDGSQLRFGLCYRLCSAGGRLTSESDVWLGTLWPDPGVPAEEWFSTKPIPVIEGPNSGDPRLLGLDDYES